MVWKNPGEETASSSLGLIVRWGMLVACHHCSLSPFFVAIASMKRMISCDILFAERLREDIYIIPNGVLQRADLTFLLVVKLQLLTSRLDEHFRFCLCQQCQDFQPDIFRR